VTDELAEFEAAVIPLIPSGLAVIGGSAVSPDGRYGAILTIFPNAGGLATEWLFESEGDRWVDAGGGSAGVCFTSLDDERKWGVLRYADEAPSGSMAAVIAYEGREYRAPVREGWFYFAVWNTTYTEEPRLLRFE
jgi:hypothetical protein